MRTRFWKFLPYIGAAALAFAVAPGATAQCALPNKPIKPMMWHPQGAGADPALVSTGFDFREHDPAIVGMWHVVFTAHTQNGQAIPTPGAVIDNAVVVWHRDGTEIMNSARSPQDGNFCLGIWRSMGNRTYLLNHIAWKGNIYDPTVPPDAIGAPQSGVQIMEKVTLSRDENAYSGTFTLHGYDTAGNVYVSFTGVVTGKRVTPDTPLSSLF